MKKYLAQINKPLLVALMVAFAVSLGAAIVQFQDLRQWSQQVMLPNRIVRALWLGATLIAFIAVLMATIHLFRFKKLPWPQKVVFVFASTMFIIMTLTSKQMSQVQQFRSGQHNLNQSVSFQWWQSANDTQRNNYQQQHACCGYSSFIDGPGTDCREIAGCQQEMEQELADKSFQLQVIWFASIAVFTWTAILAYLNGGQYKEEFYSWDSRSSQQHS